jgi:DNA modification methylase
MNVNKLILGDNLDIMRGMDSESVDLIYLDPPFFSNRNYEIIWGDAGEIRSFQDRWSGGIEQYISWLYERVEQMHRLLKPAGSIFLHCDWHADAYIRVQILDKLFGENNFNSHIVWERSFGTGSSKNIATKLPVNVDTIFYYNKNKDLAKYNLQTRPINEAAVKRYDKVDEDGRKFFWADMRTYSKERLDELLEKGEAKISPNAKNPRYKKYLDMDKGTPIDTMWNDFNFIGNKERIGYPTQKPEALMERIIAMASNEGDVILDPFVGGGTTIAVADKLMRHWIGIDQSPMAVKVADFRLQRQTQQLDMFNASCYELKLHKYDYDELNARPPHEFESWIIQQYGGVPQNKKGGDKGVDGKMRDGTPIQVKQSKGIGVNVVKNFSVSAKQYNKTLFEKNVKEKKPVGYIIAFSFGKGAIEETARLKNSENIIIELVCVDTIVEVAHRPAIKLDVNELERDAKGNRKIEFAAAAQSAAGIEFYTWDFEYNKEKGFNPHVIMDKEGRQTLTLKAGAHNIAVKAVDNDGMENTEVISLKVNGAVELL